jgi:long-chain acyl-CoA synthetase
MERYLPTATGTAQAAEIAEVADPELLARRPWIRQYDPGVPPTLDGVDTTLGEVLRETARSFGDRVALVWYGREISYADLDHAADRFARALAADGVRPGDHVALLLPNSPQFVIAYYGGLRAGAILVPLNPLYTAPELEQQLTDSGARVLVTLSMFHETVGAVRRTVRLDRVIVANVKDYFPPLLRVLFTLLKEKKEGHRAELGAGEVAWPAFLAGAQDTPVAHVAQPGDVAVFGYTGGTTGVPKAAMLTHRNLVTNMVQSAVWLAGGDLDAARDRRVVVLAIIPFFHSYGQTVAMNLSILAGATVVLQPRFDPVDTLKAIQKHRPTHFPGVPALYIALLNHPRAGSYKLDSIEVCQSGAAPLPVEVQSKFERVTGTTMFEGYGMTELSPASHSTPLHGLRKPGSIGVPLPGIDARVVDLDTGTTELPTGEIGELLVKGPTVMAGYYNRPDETAATIRDGWLYTGDIAKVDEDGFFYIVDRKKDMILSNGFNVYPRDVEEVLFSHAGVADAVVIGAPNTRGDETVKAFVVRAEGPDGAALTEEGLIGYCRERLARYKAPRAVEFRDALPKTMIGKALRRVLVEEERRKVEAATAAAAGREGATA